MILRLSTLLIIGWWCQANLYAQQLPPAVFPLPNDTAKVFTLSMELRPRTELRNGYKQLRNDTTKAAFYTTQRTRLYATLQQKRFTAAIVLQDAHTWGENDPRAFNGTAQLFEAYVEPYLSKNWSVRIGRQRILLDNERLFAQNEWRQSARYHDGVSLHYKNDQLTSNLSAAYNQPAGEPTFNGGFFPAYENYKLLALHYLRYTGIKKWALTVLNADDAFQRSATDTRLNNRMTSGGRIEFSHKKCYATCGLLHQYGHTPTGKPLSAYYLQPEIKLNNWHKLSLRLGAEVMSGNDNSQPITTDRSFVALYGVAHRFNGTMDYFTRFPADLRDAGLVNPYFFSTYNINPKFTLRSDYHLFYSHQDYYKDGVAIDRFLGFENDWLLTYQPTPFITLDYGFSYMLPTKSMEVIRSGNSDLFSYWSYISISFKPQLLQYVLKK